jgi:hypothetical protein
LNLPAITRIEAELLCRTSNLAYRITSRAGLEIKVELTALAFDSRGRNF